MTTSIALILIVLGIVNRFVSGSSLYPPVVFCLWWGFVLALLSATGDLFYPVSWGSVQLYLYGGLAFTAGGFVALHLFRLRAAQSIRTPLHQQFISRILNAGLIVAIVCFPLYVQYMWQISALSGLDSFWTRLRMGAIEVNDLPGGGPLHFYVALVPMYTVLAFVAVYEYCHTGLNKFRMWALVTIALAYQSLTMARSNIAQLAVGCLAIYAVTRKRWPLRPLVLCGVAFGLVFTVYQFTLNKMGAEWDASPEHNLKALGEGAAGYAVGALVAFEAVVERPGRIENTWKPYKFFIRTLNKFGARLPELSQHLEYTDISPTLNTNVYTFYFPYFKDYGFAGVICAAFIFGLFASTIYILAVSGSVMGVICYGVAIYGVLMTTFAECVCLDLGLWIKAVGTAWILYYGYPRMTGKAVQPRSEPCGG